MKCKLFGHKWNHYKEIVEQTVSSSFSSKEITILVDTQFRICERCQYKQERKHFTGKDTDWYSAELSTEQLRDKKLKELGI
jgi:hypothetical protein